MAIVARTVKGKDLVTVEGLGGWHGRPHPDPAAALEQLKEENPEAYAKRVRPEEGEEGEELEGDLVRRDGRRALGRVGRARARAEDAGGVSRHGCRLLRAYRRY